MKWLGNQYQIRISRLPGREPLRDVCCRESPALARRQADRLVRDLYPHTCDKADCAPWVIVGHPPAGAQGGSPRP